MKRIIPILTALLALVGCQKHYEFNTDFAMPESVDCPASVVLDVTSSQTVVFSWTGGKAADGGLVLYDVLFDKAGGNFSNPVDIRKSDQGALSQLTLSHAELNTIARKAGIKPNESGSLIWTVRGSKGGFYLARSPETITLLEILETMEGPISVVGCATSPEKCNRQALCPMRNVWQRLNNDIRKITEAITLEDILDSYRTQNAEDGFWDYCI